MPDSLLRRLPALTCGWGPDGLRQPARTP